MKNISITLILSFIIFSSVLVHVSDTLTLANQITYGGKILKIKNCSVVFKTNDTKYIIPVSKIQSIKFEDSESKTYKKYLTKASEDDNSCLSREPINTSENLDLNSLSKGGVLYSTSAEINTDLADCSTEEQSELENNDLQYKLSFISCYQKYKDDDINDSSRVELDIFELVAVLLLSGNL